MRLLTPEELAAQLQVSQSALAKWRMRNKGPRHIKVGSLVRYSNEAVLEWLEECESNQRYVHPSQDDMDAAMEKYAPSGFGPATVSKTIHFGELGGKAN